MTLTGLLDAALGDPALRRIAEALDQPDLTVSGPQALAPFAIATLTRQGRTVLAVTSTGREAEDLAATLGCLVDPDRVAIYPGWETLAPRTASRRARTRSGSDWRSCDGWRTLSRTIRRPDHSTWSLRRSGRCCSLRLPVLGELTPVTLRVGDSGRELTDIVADLVAAGYARADLVEQRGDFAVRGGILDVFPPTEEHPLRVEFWGDEVEEIRYFTVADQRSIELAEHGLWAPPCRELLLTDDVQARAGKLLGEHPELAELLDPISRGDAVEGMEALAPVLVDRLQLVLHELPAGTHVVLTDPERIRTRAADLVRTSEEFLAASWAAAAGGGRAPVDLGAASLWSLDDAATDAARIGLPWWGITPLTPDEDLQPDTVTSGFETAPAYRGDLEAALADLKRWTRDGWRVALVFDGHGTAERAVERLECGRHRRAASRSTPAPEPASSRSPPGSCPAGWCRRSRNWRC